MSMSRNRRVHAWSIALVCALVFLFSASPLQVLRASQDPVTPPVAGQDPAAPAAGRGAGRGGPQPYASVVTAAFTSDDGVFKVHTNKSPDTVLFEIPNTQLDKDFVWDVSIKKTTIGAGFGGQNVSSRTVRWTKRGDRLLLLNMDYSITADADEMVARAVADANYPAIISTLDIRAYNADRSASVVDMTTFFKEGVAEFRAGAAIGGRGIAADRSFLERAVSFPENVNVEATLTFTGWRRGGRGWWWRTRRRRRGARHARAQRHGRRASQHSEVAGHAHDVAQLRRARGLRHGQQSVVRHR
jgi:hypothetical protein